MICFCATPCSEVHSSVLDMPGQKLAKFSLLRTVPSLYKNLIQSSQILET